VRFLLTRRATTLVVLLAVLVAGLVPGAAAAETSRYQMTGLTAGADFYGFPPGAECWYSEVHLYASSQAFSGSGGSSSSVYATMSIYLNCGSYYKTGYAGADVPVLASTKSLATARLQGTFTGALYNYGTNEQEPITLAVDVGWTATAAAVTTKSSTTTSGDYYKVKVKMKGTSRWATASGTVLLGDVNLTPQETTSGLLTSSESMTVEIVH
jgi:hypothetical protein